MDGCEIGVDSALPRVVVDRRVVDQDVQPTVSLLHGPEALIDAYIVGDVEPNELRAECVGGRAPLLLVARGQDRAEAVFEQLSHDLATDSSIRTRNKGKSTLVRHGRSLRILGGYVATAVWDHPGRSFAH
jgi:hypothetical protein